MDFHLNFYLLFCFTLLLLFANVQGHQPEVVIEVNTSTPLEGSTALLNCTATGDPAPYIYWLNLNEALTNTSLTYTLTTRSGGDNTVIASNGWYVCIGVNRYGIDVSRIVKLNEQSLINVTSNYSRDVLQYNSLALPCCINGPVTPREHYWIKTEGNRDISNSSQHTLVLSNANYSDSGTYICIGGSEESVGVVAYAVTVHKVCYYSIANRSSNLQVNTRVYRSLDNVDINPTTDNVSTVINTTLQRPQSYTAVLNCSCFLNERETHFIYWQKLNSSLTNTTVGQNTSRLLIPNLQYNDSGLYQCISGTLSNITLSYTNLTVTDPPEVLPTGAPITSTAVSNSLLKFSNKELLRKIGIGIGGGVSGVIVLILSTLLILCLCCKKGIFGSSYAKYTGIESERLWDIVTCRRNKKSLLSYAIQVQRPDRVDMQGNMFNVADIMTSDEEEEEEEEEVEENEVHTDSESVIDLPVKWNLHRPFDD